MPVATENKREIFIFENYLMFWKLFPYKPNGQILVTISFIICHKFISIIK